MKLKESDLIRGLQAYYENDPKNTMLVFKSMFNQKCKKVPYHYTKIWGNKGNTSIIDEIIEHREAVLLRTNKIITFKRNSYTRTDINGSNNNNNSNNNKVGHP